MRVKSFKPSRIGIMISCFSYREPVSVLLCEIELRLKERNIKKSSPKTLMRFSLIVKVTPKYIWQVAIGQNFQMTCLPKGISDNSTSFRCCLAKGIPIMVMKRISANTRCTIAVHNPPVSNQIILQKSERQPDDEAVFTIFFPNGHRTSPASLKHCSPQGIPMIVTQS